MIYLTASKAIVILGATYVIGVTVGNVLQRMKVEPLPRPEQAYMMVSVPDKIVKESIRLGLPSHIAVDRAWMESKFNAHAVSPPDSDGGRDHGPMQLHDKFKWPPGSLTNTDLNIKAGVGFLYTLWKACDHQAPCVHRAYVTGRIVRDP